MNSGKKLVFIAFSFGCGLVLAASPAHTPASTTGGMLTATELVHDPAPTSVRTCSLTEHEQDLELRFEMITADLGPDELRRLLSRGTQRTVDYEWNPDTGELTFNTHATFKPPAAHGAASRHPLASCESR